MELTDLPNIGPMLAKNLCAIGVETPEALQEMGPEQAWLRIRLQVDSGACLHQLQALVSKKDLTPERKGELKAFFDSHK